MRRNVFSRTAAEAARLARVAARTTTDSTAPNTDTDVVAEGGSNDTVTGEWQAYGKLDLTTFGETFRLG